MAAFAVETTTGERFHVTLSGDGDTSACGRVRIDFDPAVADTTEGSYVVDVAATAFSNAWLARLVRAFECDSGFRERLPRSNRPPPEWIAALAPSLAMACDVLEAECDIVVSAASLGEDDPRWRAGASRHPGIILARGHFPASLQQAWWNAGFRAYPAQVHACAPVGQAEAGARALVASLEDWQAGRLDLDGARYRLDASRGNSRPALPPVAATRPRSAFLADIVALNAQGERAKFGALVALKSGRDEWSRQRPDVLAAALARYHPDLSVPRVFADDVAQSASWMRWVLRGLDPKIAEAKLLAEAQVRAHARTRLHSGARP